MKVKYIPYQPHCFAFGGFEIQMLSTLEAVIKRGVQAEKIDVWSRDKDFDILHCWGLGFQHYETMQWAKRTKKKVVLTALLSYYENYTEKLKHLVSSYLKKTQYYIEIARNADSVVVVNEQQADICRQYFKVPINKIHVIPNVVHNDFFTNSSNATFSIENNIKDYVLTVGNVCRRKNQLSLVQACMKLDVKLVIIGKLLEGEEFYGDLIEKAISNSPKIIWIKGLPAHSGSLVSAYQNSAVVALPSFVEQQPIALLEAVAMGKPLVIADKAYAYQNYYANAMRVKPNSVQEIVKGIEKVIANPDSYTPSSLAIEECRESNIGDRYRNLYETVLR